MSLNQTNTSSGHVHSKALVTQVFYHSKFSKTAKNINFKFRSLMFKNILKKNHSSMTLLDHAFVCFPLAAHATGRLFFYIYFLCLYVGSARSDLNLSVCGLAAMLFTRSSWHIVPNDK